jgi:hypothetical protein
VSRDILYNTLSFLKCLLCDSDFCRQFGAEVIKVEPPKLGDPLRVWRELDEDGTSPWFRSIGRNKKSVAIDMRKPEGREYVNSELPVCCLTQIFLV